MLSVCQDCAGEKEDAVPVLPEDTSGDHSPAGRHACKEGMKWLTFSLSDVEGDGICCNENRERGEMSFES